MYFYYGIKHSSLEEGNTSENLEESVSAGNIELTVTDTQKQQPQQQQTHPSYTTTDRSIYEGQQLDAFGQPVFGSTNFGGTPSQRPETAGQSSLFIDHESFPTWDDWAATSADINIYIWWYQDKLLCEPDRRRAFIGVKKRPFRSSRCIMAFERLWGEGLWSWYSRGYSFIIFS